MDETAWRTAANPLTPVNLFAWIEQHVWVQSPRSLREQLLVGAALVRRIWELIADDRIRDLVKAAEGRADGTTTNAEFDEAVRRLPQAAIPWPRPGVMHSPGIVNYNELPLWVRYTHGAARLLGALSIRGVSESAAHARAHHAAEHAPDPEPIDEQIAAINKELDRCQREYDDAVWRGMSAATQKAADLRQRREQADASVQELQVEQRAIREAVRAEVLNAEFAVQADLLRCVVGNPFRQMPFDPAWRTETVALLAKGIDADRAYDRLPVLADALEEAGCDDADLLAHCRTRHHARGCHAVDAVLRI